MFEKIYCQKTGWGGKKTTFFPPLIPIYTPILTTCDTNHFVAPAWLNDPDLDKKSLT